MSSSNNFEIPETSEGKINYAKKLKDDGNDQFKQGNYLKAIKLYKTIFLYVTGLESNLMSVMSNNNNPNAGSSASQTLSETEQLQVTANLNIAQCYLKLEKYEQALEYSQRALKLEPNNIKGRLRKALAHLGLNDIDNSERALEDVSKEIPNDPLVKQGYKKLEALKKEHRTKEKKMMMGIFSGLGSDQ
ncbi:hypothetical protein C9374_004489 [Naegleria lovaniensis]|uniref:peptidylprolyl isomerase n=1 Tax=Naegleria lovaniensis TaxID=51637 RepID=A0AA88GRS9_NAELO|nr:uncharacterized protein C9374_004489 [Naegleria lovaniensis]KAG2383152.1 hypothetical protein C9374_004489 [Naegleria lovaniensis]